MRRLKFLIITVIYSVLCIAGFNALIVQQENVLRKYFITSPRERIREYNLTLSDSLFKYFVRENRGADLAGVADYLGRYGRSSLFETLFIYKGQTGGLFQISKTGVEPVSNEVVEVSREKVYPVSIDNGRIDGYLVIVIKDSKDAEYDEGFKKYRALSFSLRVLFFLFVFALAIIALYHNYSKKMALARDMAEAKASNDGLTGLFTHEYFIDLFDIEIEKFKIYGLPLAIIMVDVDRFKAINDEYGHIIGDRILLETAKTVKSTTRSTDICARYGGEEFAILMPSAYSSDDMSKAKTIENFVLEIKGMAERIRKNVEGLVINLDGGRVVKVTISMGISFCHNRREHITRAILLERADRALYNAKDEGRNRIFIDHDSLML